MSEIPQQLLRPPEAYVDGHVKSIFEMAGFGGLPLWTQSGCTLFVHTHESVIEVSRAGSISVELRFEEVDGVPLIWFDLNFEDQAEGSGVYVFLNILDEQSVACLQALPYQRWIVIHWYDQNREYKTSSAVEWSPENQKRVRAVTEKAREVIERTGGGDFDEAINRVKGGTTLS